MSENPNETTWKMWMEGATIDEIATARKTTTHAAATRIAHVIVTEFGDWGLVRAEKRLRTWAVQIGYKVRGHLRKGHNEWTILRECNITRNVYRALRAGISGSWNRTRGPSIRGAKLAKLIACYEAKISCATAAMVCEVSRGAAESVYARIANGRVRHPEQRYIYHRDGSGFEEIKEETPCE